MLRAAALLALSLSAGCHHFRTHEWAPPASRARDLAAAVAARAPAPTAKIPRTPRVVVTAKLGEINPYTTEEQVAVELVPLWPYARAQGPLPEIDQLQPVLQHLAFTRFSGHPASPPDVTLELAFSERTYQRFTRTVYGLSLWGGIALILGYPTNYYTVRLEADLTIREARDGPPLLRRRIDVAETAANGTIFYFWIYNTFTASSLLKGAPILTWDDVLAEALVDFLVELDGALAEAFPAAGS